MKSFKEWRDERTSFIDVPDHLASLIKGRQIPAQGDARKLAKEMLLSVLQDIDAGKHIDPNDLDMVKAYVIAAQKKEILGQA